MLWIDKYRPATLDKLTFHPEVNRLLEQMSKCNDIPHLMFYGPSGGGKKTRVSALITGIYKKPGKIHAETKVVQKTAVATSSAAAASAISTTGPKVEINVVMSNCHIELNPSDVGNTQDKMIIQEVIKEIASSPPLNTLAPFKTIVIHEADRMSREAQDALRRTMEKYSKTCRIILIATSACRISAAIRSRCLQVRVPLPPQEQVAACLRDIARCENVTLPEALAATIAKQSGGNVRKAVLSLEAEYARVGNALSESTRVQRPDWEVYLQKNVVDVIVCEQTPATLAKVRMAVYELLTHCIPPELILKQLTLNLICNLEADFQHELIKWASYYEHRIHLGSKAIYHIEAFIAKFMSLYAHFMEQLTMDI